MIAAIPLGGYVKMLDEREGPVERARGRTRAFNRQSVWRRFAIVVAGPVANFLLAIALYAALFMSGLPEARPVLGAPPAGTRGGARPGLRAGDTVRAVDGEPIATWQDLRWRVLQSALQRQPLRLEVLDERGHLRDATLDLRAFPADDVESDALERIGLRLYRPPLEPVIGQVVARRRGGARRPARRRPRARRRRQAGRAAGRRWSRRCSARPEQPLRARRSSAAARASDVEVVPDAVDARRPKRIGRIGAAPQIPAGARRAHD